MGSIGEDGYGRYSGGWVWALFRGLANCVRPPHIAASHNPWHVRTQSVFLPMEPAWGPRYLVDRARLLQARTHTRTHAQDVKNAHAHAHAQQTPGAQWISQAFAAATRRKHYTDTLTGMPIEHRESKKYSVAKLGALRML